MPCTINAAIKMAHVTEPGTPSKREVMPSPSTQAPLPTSAAVKPSMDP